jgi:hypothetical protein
MKRERYINCIVKSLNSLVSDIESRGKLNLLDIHNHAEKFFAIILNIIYDYNLKSANIIKNNYKSVDLIDDDKKIIVQVTSEATSKKIQNTLNEIDIKFNGYKLLFIIIAKDIKNLSKKSYENKNKITFDPEIDIIGIDKINSLINAMVDIDNIEKIYDCVLKELVDTEDIFVQTSDLAQVINCISKISPVNEENSINILKYNIDEKIEFNNIVHMEETINKYKIYYNELDKIYDTFAKEGEPILTYILEKINKIYKEILIRKEYKNSDDLFLQISENILKLIKNKSNLEKMSEEKLDRCIDIIVVDVFIRCMIFKNPNEK